MWPISQTASPPCRRTFTLTKTSGYGYGGPACTDPANTAADPEFPAEFAKRPTANPDADLTQV